MLETYIKNPVHNVSSLISQLTHQSALYLVVALLQIPHHNAATTIYSTLRPLQRIPIKLWIPTFARRRNLLQHLLWSIHFFEHSSNFPHPLLVDGFVFQLRHYPRTHRLDRSHRRTLLLFLRRNQYYANCNADHGTCVYAKRRLHCAVDDH